MFVHAVYFWSPDNLTEEERKSFEQGLRSLTTVGTVRYAHIGVPAPTDRPVIDRTYSYALLLQFDDQAGHDTYQTHPTHLAFVEQCSRFWTQVKIYDSISV